MEARRKDDDARPVDPHTGARLGPFAQPGYYPGYDTLGQQNFWDAKTRDVVLDRVHNVPAFRFFDERQAALLTAVCERIIPQSDRDDDHKIPIAPQIDKRLYEDKHDGYRYEVMPPDREAFAMALRAFDAPAVEFAQSARNGVQRRGNVLRLEDVARNLEEPLKGAPLVRIFPHGAHAALFAIRETLPGAA